MADTTPDTFPRASARTQRFTRGAPRSMHLDPTGERLLFVRSAHGTDPVGALWSLDVASGDRDGCSPTRAACSPAATRSCRRPSGPAANAVREAGGGIVGFATDREAGVVVVRAVQPAVGHRPGRRRPRAPRRRRGHRPPPRPQRHLGGLRRRGRPARRAHRRHRRAHPGAAGRTTSPGVSPSSSRPRRWIAIAATGGHRTARRCSRRGSTTARCSAGTSPTRPTRRTPATEVRYPAAGSANADVTLHLLGLDGSAHRRRRGTARPTPTWCAPRGRPPVPCCRSCRGTRSLRWCSPSTPRPARRRRWPSSRTRSGSTPSPAYLPCCPTAGSSPPPSSTAPGGWSSTASRSPAPTSRSAARPLGRRRRRPARRHRQPDRGPPLAVVHGTRTRAAHRTGRPPRRAGLRWDRRGRQPARQHARCRS